MGSSASLDSDRIAVRSETDRLLRGDLEFRIRWGKRLVRAQTTTMADSAPEQAEAALERRELRSATAGHPSLEGMHSTVSVPHHEAGFWKKWRAFVGPAILISVGYMDPGNWGTDLQAGASSSTTCCGSSDWPV